MKISRLDLDGVGSPLGLVTRIFTLVPDMLIPVPIEALCEQFDITSITELETEGFEAALLTNAEKSEGFILVAKGRSPQRWRFSVSHELGHFLMPFHVPGGDGKFLCSIDDLKSFDTKEQDRRGRMEIEANQFAASLLMPPHLLRIELAKSGTPDLDKLVTLAAMFDVSKQAMAQQYVTYHREAVAIIQTRHGRIRNIFRKEGKFPWIESRLGEPASPESILHDAVSAPIGTSRYADCDAETWVSAASARKVLSMTEEVRHQQDGYALIMLHAEMHDDD